MKVMWDLYKRSGKWAYSGVSDVSDNLELWHDDVLSALAVNQNDVGIRTITERSFIMVVDLLENNRSTDNKFFKAIFLPVNMA